MKLAIPVFRFLPDSDGLKCCKPDRTQALARIVPDKIHSGMWRVMRPDGSLTDMLNKTRAKDIAWGMADTAAYLGQAA